MAPSDTRRSFLLKDKEQARAYAREYKRVIKASHGHLEARVMALSTERGQHALTGSEVAKLLGSDVRAVWSAVRRLEAKGKLFCFLFGEVKYFVAAEHEKSCYIEEDFAFSNEGLAALYRAFGTTPPKKIRRTPPFIVLDDDKYGKKYSRYQEIENGQAA
jgi:hypothetical protein